DYLHFGFDAVTLFTWISAAIVCYSAAIAMQGFVEQKITAAERLLYCVVIVTAIRSSFSLSLFGWVLFGLLFFGRRLQAKRKKKPASAG
ncbi:MAG: C4-dicarboxylate ABC transporter, partial [Spirochaetales bacterium]|nr:C4-dicarboxylate ABC transporter [Spirochaetales bacterium]